LIDSQFQIKIADFGCSCNTKSDSADDKRKSFNSSEVIGSPEFNPPEVTNAKQG